MTFAHGIIWIVFVSFLGLTPRATGQTSSRVYERESPALPVEIAEPSFSVSHGDTFNSIDFDFSHPIARRSGDADIETLGTAEFAGVHFFDAYHMSQVEIARVSALIERKTRDGDPDAKVLVVGYHTLNGETPTPFDDETQVLHTELMSLKDYLASLESRLELLMSRAVQRAHAEALGTKPRRLDMSSMNVTFAFTRVLGIAGAPIYMATVHENTPFGLALAQFVSPAIMSGYLMLTHDGFTEWAGTKVINPFMLKLGDLKTFAESRLLKDFPLNILKKLPFPAPFLSPKPGAPITDDRRIGPFAPRSFTKMLSFIMFYLGSAHLSVSAYQAFVEGNPEFASLGSWMSPEQLKKILVTAAIAVPTEQLTATVVRRISDMYNIATVQSRIHDRIDEPVFRARFKRSVVSVSAAYCMLSIANTFSGLRSAYSNWNLYTLDTSDIPILKHVADTISLNDGHAAMAGITLTLGGTYIVVESWTRLKPWLVSVKESLSRAKHVLLPSTWNRRMNKAAQQSNRHGDDDGTNNPSNGSCSNSFKPPA